MFTPKPQRNPQHGFTLTELMIALVLGLLVAAAASIIFLQGKRSFLENEQVSRVQENGRYALKVLSRDIGMAGFMGQMYAPAGQNLNVTLNSIALTTDCGPATDWFADITLPTPMLHLVDGVTGDVPAAFTPCIPAADYLANTDAIAIKRTSDSYVYATVATPATDCNVDDPCCGTAPPSPSDANGCGFDTNHTYFVTDGDEGVIFHQSATPPTALPDLPRETWEYYVNIYYIQPYSLSAGDGIPSLCREVLVDKEFIKQCLAEGIEDMQIELGLDVDQDGVVDQFEATPTTAEMNQAIMARIFLLVRGTDDLASTDNSKTYNLGSRQVGPFNDSFYRRVFSTNVQIRNVRSRNTVINPGGV